MNNPFQDKAEFEKIFKEYFEVLCNYINRHIHNWEDSREIVQNTFTKVWTNRERINLTNTVKSYLYKAVKNNMIDFIRKSKNNVELNEELILNIEDHTEEQLDTELIKRSILSGLKFLKPKTQKIFKLNKFEGLTYKEIALHLDISERSVEDNMARAFRSLKKHLESDENFR